MSAMDVNFEYYKILYHVVEHGTITGAAEALAISQPAVSQAIKNLEKSLGCSLFVRSAKGVRLTNEGEVLYSYVKRGCERIFAGERKLTEIIGLKDGEIRIGASDMTLQFYLLEYLELYHESYPEIKVTVTNAPTPETISHLVSGQIDFGVVSTPFSSKYEFREIPVREIHDIFVAGRKFEAMKNKILRYRDLEQVPYLCLEGQTSTRAYVTDFLAEEQVELQPEFELATSDMLVQFAKRSLGIASVVEDFAKGEIAKGELFKLQFDRELPARQFCVIYDDKIPMSTAARKLLDLLENNHNLTL